VNEGRTSELCTRATRAVVLGPWGAALLIACAVVILLAVPGWS
jgi:hypothetical protein